MGWKECRDKIQEMFPKLAKRAVDDLVQQVNNIRSNVFQGEGDLEGPGFREKVAKYLDQRKYEQIAFQRRVSDDILKRQRLMNFVTQDAFQGDPVEAVKAKLGGTARYSEGGNFSVDKTTTGLRAKFLNNLFFGLKEKGLDQVLLDKSLDLPIMKDLEFLRGNGEGSGDQIALEAAKVIRAVQDDVLRTLQQAGSSIRELTSYIVKQSHDREKISAVPFEEWMGKILPKLDEDKSFGPGALSEKKAAVLRDIYDQIRAGQYDRGVSDDAQDQFITVKGVSANLAEKTGRSRSLHFQDAQSLYDYNQEFGKYGVLEGMIASVNQASRQASLMYHLGSNPEGSFQALKARLIKYYSKDDAARLNLKENDKILNEWFDTARGYGSTPGTSLAARTGQNLRSLAAVSKLGMSFMSSWSDWVNSAATLRSANGDSLIGNASKLFSEYTSAFTNESERRLWAGKLGVLIDDYLGTAYAQIGAENGAPGTMSRLQRILGKASQLDRHVESAKVATAKQFAMELADHSGTAFDGLPDRVRLNLERYGINPDLWSRMGRAVEEMPDGTRAITPEGVRLTPDEAWGENGERTKFETEVKLLSYLSDQADIGSSTPGLRQRAFLLRGTPDEGMGILLRFLAQFKSVPLMAIDTAKRIALSNPDFRPETLREAVLKGKGDMNGLAQFMVASTALGYLSMSAKDLAKGKTPRDPKDPKTLQEAFVAGGAAGIYGDFLFGAFNDNHTAADAVLGPVLGGGANLATTWAKARTGQESAKAAVNSTVKTLLGYVPFQNLFYLKGAFDYLILNRVNEALNPGYTYRLEKRVGQNPGLLDAQQRYFMYRPTEVNR